MFFGLFLCGGLDGIYEATLIFIAMSNDGNCWAMMRCLLVYDNGVCNVKVSKFMEAIVPVCIKALHLRSGSSAEKGVAG